jgi:putative transposase
LHEHDFIPTDGKIRSATISEQAGRWFVSVQMEVEQEKPTPTATTAIGVDLGIKQLATLSDGKQKANPRALKHAQKRLRRLERQKARRKLGGKNRKKTCKKLAKQHARVANIRKDAAHNLTTYLCKNHALVAIEDLHVAGMLKNHKLAQAVSDSNFGEIRRQLEYKAQFSGVHVVAIARFYPSSKTCSGCRHVKPELSLSERTFVCEDCGMVLDRDLNAAKNILSEALRCTASSVETYACGERSAGVFNRTRETALAEAGTNRHCGLSTKV